MDRDGLIGTRILAGYVLRRKLGEGGMGVVYAAANDLGHAIAVKIVHPEAGVEAVARLEAEARLAQQVRHPNVVEIIAVDHLPDGRMFVAMEFLEGRSLADHLRTFGPFSTEDALPRALQLCAGVHAAHVKRILHRDLKPDNVFLCDRPAGVLKVLDFGIAKSLLDSRNLTRTGGVLGTPRYMAPEIWTRGPRSADVRADVFALGLVLFELVTGDHPYVARYAHADTDPTVEIAAMIHAYAEIANGRQAVPSLAEYVEGRLTSGGRARPPRPDITPAWIAAIDAAIAIEPSHRPATPRALAEMIIRGTPYADAIARVVAPSLYEIGAVEDATRPEDGASDRPYDSARATLPLRPSPGLTATDPRVTGNAIPVLRPTTLTATSGQVAAVGTSAEPARPTRRGRAIIVAGVGIVGVIVAAVAILAGGKSPGPARPATVAPAGPEGSGAATGAPAADLPATGTVAASASPGSTPHDVAPGSGGGVATIDAGPGADAAPAVHSPPDASPTPAVDARPADKRPKTGRPAPKIGDRPSGLDL